MHSYTTDLVTQLELSAVSDGDIRRAVATADRVEGQGLDPTTELGSPREYARQFRADPRKKRRDTVSRRVTLALSVLWIVGAFIYLTRGNGEWPHGVVLFGPTCVLSLISWAITTVAARRRARRFLAMDASARSPRNAT